jgi:hypothetical protein
VHDIYLTKEQHLLGMVNWLVKDPEAWDLLCDWWASEDFRSISKRNLQNQLSKSLVHRYDTDGHVCKTQKMVQ